jgi:type II secretory pathway predicted ATPase ExeA
MKIYEYFGLKKDPFSMIPDPNLFYESEPHSSALTRVLFSIENNRGAVAITGDVGTGKSILLRKILLNLYENQGYEPFLVICAHSDFDREWFLKKLTNFYSEEESEDNSLKSVIKKVMEKYEKDKEKAVLLIDEADKIQDKEIMEDLRNLLNLEVFDEKVFHLVLVGSRKLAKNLRNHMPFYQRIAIWSELTAFSEEEVGSYIKFRVEKCGGNRDLFTEDAVSKITLYSEGVPRLINVICDSALLEAYINKKDVVDEEIVEKIAGVRGLK